MEGQGKDWASEYILDPLQGSNPSLETGPSSSFRPKEPDGVKDQSTGGSTNPFRRSTPASTTKTGSTTHSREVSSELPRYRPQPSGSEYRKEAFPSVEGVPSRTQSTGKRDGPYAKSRPRRASSLSQRYPGDKSHEPLKMLERENKLAHRSPHLRKQHQPRADTIDHLDDALGNYHHEGPYDAALLVRNSSYESSPLAAVSGTNEKALRATPKDKIDDSLNDHRPLDGTAAYPPGVKDPLGNTLYYEEGENMMTAAGGDYKRWPGVQYHPDDIKGKGEPSYTIEKNLKQHEKRDHGGERQDIELVERPRRSHDSKARRSSDEAEGATSGGQRYSDWERGTGHSRNISGELRRRIGSLKRK